jgi:hypothetical protein
MSFQRDFKANTQRQKRMQRKLHLREKYESASLKCKLGQPQNWKFAFMPSPNQKQPNDEFNFYQDDDAKHVNADTNNDSADETMSEYPQSSNSNASNIPHSNPMQEANVYSNLQNRQNQSSFIPQTCPNRRKHSPKRHNIESQVQSQSQSETSVSSSDQSQLRMQSQAHEEINIDDIENGVDSSDIQSDVPISSPSPSVTISLGNTMLDLVSLNKAPTQTQRNLVVHAMMSYLCVICIYDSTKYQAFCR